jgi:rubrerythrin
MEKQAHDFYIWASEKSIDPGAKVLLDNLAKEELEHKKVISDSLEKRDKMLKIGSGVEKIEDLKITDWLDDVMITETSSYQDILIYASKREKETYEYYQENSQRTREKQISKLFAMLAQEELKHKNKIEKEYDKYVLEDM